jgi:predicted Zn finger-like uncharacterized protein
VKISCPNCSAAYELDDSRVPPAGLSIKCPRCKNPFTVHRAKAEGAAKPAAAQGAVPLPGQNGAKPAAAAKPPAGRPPGARKPSAPGAIPLPGMEKAVAAPPPAPAAVIAAGAVPLPGLDGAAAEKPAFRPPSAAPIAPPPPGDAGAVPLPGFASSQQRQSGATADDPFAAIELGAEPAPRPPPPADVDDLELPDPMPRPGSPRSSDGDAFAVVPKQPKPPAKVAAADEPSFDFVDAPRPAPSQASPAPAQGGSAPDLLDFVDEAPKTERKGKRPPPPMVGKSDSGPEEMLSLDDAPPAKEPAGAKKPDKERKKHEREERAARERAERVRRKTQRASGESRGALQALAGLATPKRLIGAGLALALAAVTALGIHARTTPAGLFWMNRYLPSRKAASAAETRVIERGLARLGQGDFAGAREAVAAAAQLLATVPDDEEVKAFFVLAASEMKLEYGQVGGDWDQARRVVEKMKGTRSAQNRARGAYALASGDVQAGKQVLAALGDASGADPESTWLYAQALILAGEGVRASQLLDAALKTRAGAPRLLLLRGNVARDRGQLAEAAGFYQKALQASPDSARALVELADVRLRMGDGKGAAELLAKALDSDRRKTLDAGEEARANVMRGRLLSAAHDVKGAEAAFEHAVMLDPGSAPVHQAYGDFRIQQHEWEKASRQFESAIQHGGGAAAYAGAARAFLGQNRLLEADKAITEAVTRDAGNARFLYLQGRVADAIGKAEEAYRKYEAALKAKPDLVEALAAEGVVWMSRNDKAKAQERLDAAMAVKPEGLTLLEDEAIGDLALAMGEPKKAQEAFARALEKDEGDAAAHAGVGKALAAQGDLRGARKEMETALKQMDGDASLAYEYGSLLRRTNEPDAALAMLRNAVKLDSKEPRYRARLGAILVERGEFEEAEQQLRQAVLMNDRYPEGLYFLARALAGRKKQAEAIDVMKKAVEVEPDNAEYLYQLGLIYERGQQIQDAVDAFTRSIDRSKKNADAYEHLGLSLMIENRFQEAATAFGKAAELDPKRARAWGEKGDAEQQGGDLDGAIRDFQKALSMDPSLPSVWTRLGIAYKDKDCKGCRARAVDALKRATHVDPADVVAHHELGYMYKDDGRRKEAIAEFRRYLALKPDAGDASTVKDDIYYLEEESRRAP